MRRGLSVQSDFNVGCESRVIENATKVIHLCEPHGQRRRERTLFISVEHSVVIPMSAVLNRGTWEQCDIGGARPVIGGGTKVRRRFKVI